MLDRLPYELIEQITSHLDIIEVISSMTTCRTWYELLKFYLLKNEITLRNHEQFKEIAINIKAKKLNTNYIRKVHMKQPFYDCTEMNQLPILFPNLQQLIGESPSACYKQLLYNPNSINLSNLSSAIEHLQLERLGFFTIELLQRFTFNRLTHLLLDFMGASYSAKELLPTLKNLPSLESLELVSLAFQNTTMELLHRNVPTLKKLVLVDVAMMFESGLPTYTIEPAPNLQSLHIIGDSVAYDDHLHFIKYITLKYSSMNDLVLDMLYFQDDYDQQIYVLYQEAILQLIDNLPRIMKTLRLQILPLKKEILDRLGSKKMQVKETVLFRDNPFSDGISVSDFFKCEVAETVETLWILGYSAFEIQNSRMESRLTTLCIRNISVEYNAPLNIHQLLLLHPKLEELSIEDRCIDIACELTCTLKSLPLKRLRLDVGQISDKIPSFIRRYVPHLTLLSLFWANCYSKTPIKHIKIYLPKHQLQLLEIQNNQMNFNCAIKTDLGMKRYSYSEFKSKNRHTKKSTMLYSGTSRDHPQSDAVVVECKNLWSLIVNSKRVI
ncbi:hypothetical protein K501DRAFT_302294 [Backusella circina FSU 941]|nr:hypothetical protein K501DRAFT_302294 [Backusella circina FSU 941]